MSDTSLEFLLILSMIANIALVFAIKWMQYRNDDMHNYVVDLHDYISSREGGN